MKSSASRRSSAVASWLAIASSMAVSSGCARSTVQSVLDSRSCQAWTRLVQHQLVVKTAAGHELCMRTLLDEPSVAHDQDQVGIHDRAQPMRDDNRGTAEVGQVAVHL